MDGNTEVTTGGATGAENTTETGNQQEQTKTDNQQEQNEEKTYSEKDFQSEVDKRVTEAIKTANAKSEKAFEKQLADARAQWEKESKMTEAEREEAAQKKAREDFEAEKAAFAHERLVSRAATQLVKNGLPEEIAELITASDAEEEKIGEGIAAIKAAFDKAVEAAVTEKLKGASPETGGDPNNNTDPFLSGFGN